MIRLLGLLTITACGTASFQPAKVPKKKEVVQIVYICTSSESTREILLNEDGTYEEVSDER